MSGLNIVVSDDVGLGLLGNLGLVPCPRRFRSQIYDQAADAHTEADQRVLQRHECRRPEKAKRCQRPYAQDPADLEGNLLGPGPLDQLPDQGDVCRVHKEEDGGLEGDRLGRQFAHRHPRRGEGKQRHRKKMRKIEPQQSRRRFDRVAHQVVVISPDDGNE